MIKSKSSVADTNGVRQRLKFEFEASGIALDPKKSKETVKQGEIRESNSLSGCKRIHLTRHFFMQFPQIMSCISHCMAQVEPPKVSV